MPECIARMAPAASCREVRYMSAKIYIGCICERRKDTKFCASLRRLLGSRKFTMLMICIISINAVSLALETSHRSRLCRGTFFEVTDAFCIAIHTTELLLKLYVDPIAYWKSSYNILDAAILLVAFLPHASPADTAACTHLEGTTEGLQTLRILKPIKRGSGMRVFTETLGQTVQTVMYALILLCLLMCVFAVLGHGWYGDPKTGDIENWGSLKAALFTLFSLVTVDGWTDLQRKMDHYGFMSSHVFIVVFILLGHFIFFSILIALVITKTQLSATSPEVVPLNTSGCCTGLELDQGFFEAQVFLTDLVTHQLSGARGLTRIPAVWCWQDLTQKHEQDCKAAKKAAVWAKRQKILKKRGKNVSNQVTLEQHKIAQGEGFSELLDDIKKTLRLSDVITMEGFCFTIPFIHLYLPFLDLQDDTLNRLQHHYYKRTGILMEIVEVTKEKSLPDHEKTKS
ncbi:PREDICTED: cation channel sperm-associated protein 3 [Fulmarus glacialis]|uniref:cation channel sperm-associated protein 3 n=1 Tax=Fulmarus glacialis TaxID=30455 RepID=UPI00051C04DB|nr:PREDICTED: cation channel sperm-associated protein 3 [Fulmarus glacialis]